MNLDKLNRWLAEGKTDAIENAWMDALGEDTPLEPLRTALDTISRAGHKDLTETLGWMCFEQYLEGHEPSATLDAGRVILPAMEGSADVRQTVADLFRQQYGEHEHFDALLEASGLLGNQTLRRSINTLDVCLALSAGSYLASRFEPDVRRVEGFDPALVSYELAAPDGSVEEMEPKLLADEYEAVQPGDFRALLYFDRDALAEQVEKDPAALLESVCLARGGEIDMPELKDLLVDNELLTAKGWSRWWSRARNAAKKGHTITIEGRSPAVVRYFPEGLTLEEELAPQFAEAVTPMGYYTALRQYTRDAAARGQAVNEDFARQAVDALAEQSVSFQQRRPIEAVEAALAVEVLAEAGLPAPTVPAARAVETLAAVEHPGSIVAALSEDTLWQAGLAKLGQLDDAPSRYVELFRMAPANRLDEVAHRLRADGQEAAITEAINDFLLTPRPLLQVGLWLWAGPAEDVPQCPALIDLFSRICAAAHEVYLDANASRAYRRDCFQQVRNTLTAGGGATFRQMLQQIDRGVAATVKKRIERSEAFSRVARETLVAILRDEHYELFVEKRVDPWLDEKITFALPESIDRMERELKEIMEIRMPENSRAIGAAADLGDLSENSEWQFAVEEQRRLQAQASQLQNDLAGARALHPGEVPTDYVAIGAKVTLKRPDGTSTELTLLGPWESNVAERIYSYRTPLAQAMMGKAVGETVTLTLDGAEGEYTIESVAPWKEDTDDAG